jgi:predicted nucleic acid-binding protein
VTVFVDTSALYAVLDVNDPDHERAAGLLAQLRDDLALTHNYVVAESAAVVQRRLGMAAVRALLGDLLEPVETVWIDEVTHRSAVAAFVAASRTGPSLVDWTSFEVMRRRGIDTAFAFDGDFRRQGFDVVP